MRLVTPVLLAGLGLVLSGCGSSGGGGYGAAGTGGSQAASAGTSAPPAATASGAIRIAGFAYDPSPLTVTPGQVVSVTNTDSAEHTASSDRAGLFVADDVTTGKTVTFKAPAQPGTYTFHCQYHASMHGTLIVK